MAKSLKRERSARPQPARRPTRGEAERSGTGRDRSIARPWPLFVMTALAFVAAVAALGWDLSESWRAPPAVAGQVVIPDRGGISAINPTSGQSRSLLSASVNASVTAVALSPNRSRIAYAMFHKRPEDRVSSSEIFVIPASGGDPELLVERDRPGSIVDTPVWTPDGQSLVFSYQGTDGRLPVARVERMTLADRVRTSLYQGASFPDVSPDGQMLVFVHDDAGGQSLTIGTPSGGDARAVVPATTFTSVMGPRFSPDGSRIVFSAVGPGPAGASAAPSERPSAHRLTGILDLFVTPVAYAHGEPWGIWTVRPDGSDLRRASNLQEDEPLASWSPDGAWIAVFGGGGLWIVDSSGSGEPKRIADGSFGAIDW
ncbi:MAG: PD40 domain-containing protein [Chloroflexi bacterium]|nr:PD40 domain-containing protein [Chloroflexota bacterium]